MKLHKRVDREGLKLSKKQIKRQRIPLSDGLNPTHKNHVWSCDFVEYKTLYGRKVRFLDIIDEYSAECLASVSQRNWRNNDVNFRCLIFVHNMDMKTIKNHLLKRILIYMILCNQYKIHTLNKFPKNHFA